MFESDMVVVVGDKKTAMNNKPESVYPTVLIENTISRDIDPPAMALAFFGTDGAPTNAADFRLRPDELPASNLTVFTLVVLPSRPLPETERIPKAKPNGTR